MLHVIIFGYSVKSCLKVRFLNLKIPHHIYRFSFLSSDGHITTLGRGQVVDTNPTSILLLRGGLVHPALVGLLPHEAICYQLVGEEVT